jgi:dolichol-phosphate mannosyltransferase
MAFGTAFEHIAPTLQDDDWVVTLEGDNTSRHEMLRQMFTRMEEGFDVVFASPYLYGGGITNTDGIRVFLSKMANVFVKEILGLGGLVTVSSFYRLYRGAALKRLQAVYGNRIIERKGFECMVEMCLKMIYLNFTISEIAMVLDTSRRIGRSKMKIGRTIRGYVALQGLKGGWQATAKEKTHGLHSS